MRPEQKVTTMECSKCHDVTPILVDEGGLCWTCAFPRPFDLVAQQVAVAAGRSAKVVKTHERGPPQ
jgi:hypothetical protein